LKRQNIQGILQDSTNISRLIKKKHFLADYQAFLADRRYFFEILEYGSVILV